MTAAQDSRILAKLHPQMWACSSCGWRSEQARVADEPDSSEGRPAPAAPPATTDPHT